jgi:hypothetical protein
MKIQLSSCLKSGSKYERSKSSGSVVNNSVADSIEKSSVAVKSQQVLTGHSSLRRRKRNPLMADGKSPVLMPPASQLRHGIVVSDRLLDSGWTVFVTSVFQAEYNRAPNRNSNTSTNPHKRLFASIKHKPNTLLARSDKSANPSSGKRKLTGYATVQAVFSQTGTVAISVVLAARASIRHRQILMANQIGAIENTPRRY